MLPKSSSQALAGVVLLLLGSTSAYAVDAQAFGDRLKSVLAKQSVEISFATAEEAGEDVVLRDVTVAGEEGASTKLGDLTFSGVTGSTAEGWEVASVPIADVDTTNGDTRTQVTDIVLEGLQIIGTGPSSGATPGMDISFEHASIGNVDVERGGKTALNLEGAEITNEFTEGGGFNSEFNLGDFQADFTAGDMSADRMIVDELGYGQLSGSGSGSASWDPTTGDLSLDAFDLSVKDAGDVSFSYSIGGYTPSFVASLKQVQEQMAASPDDNQATGMAVLGLLSQLSLQGAELSFTDNSLTERLLDYYAKKSGQTTEQLVEGLTAMMPALLAYLQNQDFQSEVTGAVENFLKDPQSLTISIDPQAPVPAAQIIGAAMGAPQTLPSVLSLRVTANDAEASGAGAATDKPASDKPASGQMNTPAATDDTKAPATGTDAMPKAK